MSKGARVASTRSRCAPRRLLRRNDGHRPAAQSRNAHHRGRAIGTHGQRARDWMRRAWRPRRGNARAAHVYSLAATIAAAMSHATARDARFPTLPDAHVGRDPLVLVTPVARGREQRQLAAPPRAGRACSHRASACLLQTPDAPAAPARRADADDRAARAALGGPRSPPGARATRDGRCWWR
ncbi:MAG: hypothetical protein MZW92_28990 [Comamonadaceae bacterium]|nr:hypothetical protein [Comamonadaceae bacterium]